MWCIVCVILCLAVLVEHRLVTDTEQTDRAMACACIASRSKSLRRSMPISIRLFVSVFFNLITVRLSSAFCECVIIASYLFNTPIPQNTSQNENRNMKIGT